MNNNSEQINKYLEGEMSPAEKAAFEDALLHDKTLQQELNIQQQIMKAAVNAGIKAEFAKAITKKTMINRSVKWGLAIAASLVLFFIITDLRKNIFPIKGSIEKELANGRLPFINPPLAGINVPLSEYIFDAGKGATIYYHSGSIIYFPPSSLLDATGAAIKGNVKITYREFSDPLDFFVSGIPMAYDSGAVKYNFESSGMCEINAYKDGHPVFVNKNAPPEVHLSGKNKNPLHNLYFLDSTNRKWVFAGKQVITEVKEITKTGSSPAAKNLYLNIESGIPVKPLKPLKADDDKQAFSIEIDPGSFEELYAYNNLKFQVEDESSYKRSDALEHWSNVKLERTSTEGIYDITFSNASRKVTYKVRPVLEGEDYEAALKVFQQKNTAYELALQKRIGNEKILNDSIERINKITQEKNAEDEQWNTKINDLVLERNNMVRDYKKLQKTDPGKAAAIRQEVTKRDFLITATEQSRYNVDLGKSTEILSSFAINNFGIWNCDHPEYPNYEIPIAANFTDSSNNPIELPYISVVYKNFNGITQFSNSLIRVIPGKANMIWAVSKNQFYYFSYKDFEQANIDRNSKAYAFRMRTPGKIITTYDEIKELVGDL